MREGEQAEGTKAGRYERAPGGEVTVAKAMSQSSKVRQELYVLKFKIVL